jgi:hypothetical protein
MKLGTSQAAQVLTGVPVRGIMQGKNGTGEDGGHGRRARPSGRIDCGTLKRYSPINESPGAAATASLAKIEDRFIILAAITTTHDGPVWVDVAEAPPCPDRGMWSSLRNRSTAITFVRSDGSHFPL